MMKQSDKIKKKQNILYGLVFFSAAIVIGGFTYILVENEQEVQQTARPQVNVDIPTDSINPQAILNDQVEGQMDLLKNRFSVLEGFLLDAKEREDVSRKENMELRDEIQKLRGEIENKEKLSLLEDKMNQNFVDRDDSVSPFSEYLYSPMSSCEPKQGIIVKVIESKRNMIKNVETTIPSGTTVKAVLVSSVDAPCGVYSSNDPQPVKLQILDDGHLPKKVRAKLKGGVIIASAYGDLSSERLYIRVERLTQIKPTGDFIDTTITGFVTGEDGKYGVRGTIVDKSFKMISNATIVGALSGVNSFFQAYASRYTNCCVGGGSFYGDGCCNDDISGREFSRGLAIQGGTSGMDNAFNTLTDFYIKRADLIKPVLQVNAGRIVDLTFSMSTDIGDIHAQDKVEKVRKESRKG